MSVAQIIDELPKLTATELKIVCRKLAEISAENPVMALHDRGIDEAQAADLRSRLKTFAEDWERPEASIYDEDTKRGDVVLVLFPDSDLRTAKRRPALVIQRDNLNNGLPQVIVAMISSNLARRGHGSRIFVSRDSAEGKAAGLRLDSVIMTDNLATILETEMDSILGHFPEMEHVNDALKHTLALS